MTRSDPPGRVLIRTAWFRVPPGIRDQIRPPSSLDRSGGHQRGETFAQFRVSRFTGDWHWPRSNGGRTSTTFGPPTSPRGGTTGTFDVRLPNQRRRRRYVHLVRGLIRANQHYRLTPRSACPEEGTGKWFERVRSFVYQLPPFRAAKGRSSFRFQRPLTIAPAVHRTRCLGSPWCHWALILWTILRLQ